MRVIDRPDLRALSPIGECERLQRIMDKIESILRRNLTPANKIKAIEAVIANDGLHLRGGAPAEPRKVGGLVR